MCSTLTHSTPPLRQALYVLAMAKDVPDAQVLDDVVRQYPQFADELVGFAVELALDSLRETVPAKTQEAVDPGNVSLAVSRAISRFHNRLHALRQAAKTTTAAPVLPSEPVENPFAGLSRTEFRALAERIRVNTAFVIKLRDRQIDPETIPDDFKRLVADELGVPVNLLADHFAATTRESGASRQFYKAEDKPKDDQRQSFADAVRNSGLTDEAQRRLFSF